MLRCTKLVGGSLRKSLFLVLLVSFVMLPVAPMTAMADEAKKAGETVVLEDNKKTVVEDQAPIETPEKEAPEEEGMSTGMIVGISAAGALAVVGVVALASGGGSSSSPPTAAELAGPWQANSERLYDDTTYTGTYTLYENGSHSYDLYVSDGRHLVGGGSWSINEYDVEIRNNGHSTYQGVYSDGGMDLTNTAGTWHLTLSR